MISVTGLRNFLGKRMGWIMGFLALIMLLSMGLYFGGGGAGGVQGDDYVFAVIDGRKVTALEFHNALKSAQEQAQQDYGRLTPDAMYSAYRNVLAGLVSRNAMLASAEKQGIRADDKTVFRMVDQQATEQLKQMRERYISEKKLKEGASDREVMEIFRKETGKRWDQVLKEQRDRVAEMLKAEDTRNDLLAAATSFELERRIADSVKVSEADYRKAREQLTLRRILVQAAKHQDAKKRIEEVQAKLKKGEDFDKLVDQYSDEEQPTGLPGQQLKKGETGPLDRATIGRLPVLKFLADKDKGFVSHIVKLGDDYAIYKITAVNPKVPDDFQKRKAFYLDQYREEREREKMQEWQRSLLLGAKVELKDPGWQLLYKTIRLDWEASFATTPLSEQERNKQYQALLDEATALYQKKEGSLDPVILTRYFYSRMLTTSPAITDPKEKQRIQEVFRQSLTEALRRYEDSQAREMLVQEYLKDKNYKAAVAQLTAMSKFAWNPSSPEDQQVHWKVQTHIASIKAAGYDSPELRKLEEAEKKFAERARQARERELKRQEEEQRRAEEQRKRAEERRKAAEAKKKASESGSSETSTPPAKQPDNPKASNRSPSGR